MIIIDSKLVEQARSADMLAFLETRHGFTFTRRSSVYRCRQHPSLAVKDDRLSWYWHSKGIGGHGALDYLMKIENLPFRQAVASVTLDPISAAAGMDRPEPAKPLILPEKAGIPLRLYDYLCHKRGIDAGIVGMLLDNGRIYEDRRGNVVFVGYDEQNKARFASLRGTYGDCRFRMDCAGSDKRYGFSMAACDASERLYVFESPIDAVSHASLVIAEFGDRTVWEYDRRLSLGGTSDAALPFFLNNHIAVRELVFCLDNDPAGREASVAIARKYAGQGYRTRIELPQGKDYNEDLLQKIEVGKAQKNAVKLHKETCL